MDRMTDDLPPELGAAMEALNARAAARAERVDVEAVAARVRERLRRGEGAAVRRVFGLAPRVLRLAAAALVVVMAGALFTVTRHRPAVTTALQLPVTIPAADSLDSGQLEAVLKAAGEVRPVMDTSATVVASGSLSGLSEQQLQTLLASL